MQIKQDMLYFPNYDKLFAFITTALSHLQCHLGGRTVDDVQTFFLFNLVLLCCDKIPDRYKQKLFFLLSFFTKVNVGQGMN